MNIIPWRQEAKEKKEDMANWLGAKIRSPRDGEGDNWYNHV
jgi:hypothetical protein